MNFQVNEDLSLYNCVHRLISCSLEVIVIFRNSENVFFYQIYPHLHYVFITYIF